MAWTIKYTDTARTLLRKIDKQSAHGIVKYMVACGIFYLGRHSEKVAHHCNIKHQYLECVQRECQNEGGFYKL